MLQPMPRRRAACTVQRPHSSMVLVQSLRADATRTGVTCGNRDEHRALLDARDVTVAYAGGIMMAERRAGGWGGQGLEVGAQPQRVRLPPQADANSQCGLVESCVVCWLASDGDDDGQRA